MFDPIIIIFSFNMSKPTSPTFLDYQTDWFQSYEFLEFSTFLSLIQLNPTYLSNQTHFTCMPQAMTTQL